MMQLSLIIPIYRVEKYILACLQSVCQQLPQHAVQVILINDGTPDQSMQMAKDYLLTQSTAIQQQFYCIEQSNQGLSAARNRGIAAATGQYVAFLDSDDVLTAHFFSEILTILTSCPEIDIVQFQAQRLDDTGQVSPFLTAMPYSGLMVLDDAVRLTLFNRSAWFTWLRVYRRNLFDTVRFPVGRNYEDAYTTPFLFLKAQSVYFSHAVLLQYRRNAQGITATKSEKNIDDLGHGALHYLANLTEYPILTPTLVAISQSYIYDSLNVEGYRRAYQRWAVLKPKFNHSALDRRLLRNRGNRLFLRFGIYFLCVDRLLRRLGLKQ